MMSNREKVKFVGGIVISICVNTVISKVIGGSNSEDIGKAEAVAIRIGKAALSVAISGFVVDKIEERFDTKMEQIDAKSKKETAKA